MARKFNVTTSDALGAAIDILKKLRKYRSPGEYFRSLVRHDAQSLQDHPLTTEWAAFSPAEADNLDETLLQLVKSGKGIKGSLLKKIIFDCVKECIEEMQDYPRTKAVAEKLAAKIAAMAKT